MNRARLIMVGFQSGEISGPHVRNLDVLIGCEVEEAQIKRAAIGILEECESLLVVAGERLTGQFSDADKASRWALNQIK